MPWIKRYGLISMPSASNAKTTISPQPLNQIPSSWGPIGSSQWGKHAGVVCEAIRPKTRENETTNLVMMGQVMEKWCQMNWMVWNGIDMMKIGGQIDWKMNLVTGKTVWMRKMTHSWRRVTKVIKDRLQLWRNTVPYRWAPDNTLLVVPWMEGTQKSVQVQELWEFKAKWCPVVTCHTVTT